VNFIVWGGKGYFRHPSKLYALVLGKHIFSDIYESVDEHALVKN
jgi:hypothetical protein